MFWQDFDEHAPDDGFQGEYVVLGVHLFGGKVDGRTKLSRTLFELDGVCVDVLRKKKRFI